MPQRQQRKPFIRAPWRWLLRGVLGLIILPLGLWYMPSHGLAPQGAALAGLWAMESLLAGGLALIRLVLTVPHPIPAIARNTIDEAVRKKAVVAFIAALMVVIPILPLTLNPREKLSDRMQVFLYLSMMAVSFFSAVMTVVLACSTVADEINERQIFLTMTKPVRPLHYLMGKWLGIVLINSLLLAIAGISIDAMVMSLSSQRDRGDADRWTLTQQVLSARVSVPPTAPPDLDLQKLYDQRLKQLRTDEPERFPADGQVDEATKKFVQNAIIDQWHTLDPGQSRSYLFSGLQDADPDQPIQLILQARAPQTFPDGLIHLNRRVNGGSQYPYALPPDVAQTINVDPQLFAQGEMLVELTNVAEAPSVVQITPGTGLEVLFRAGSFEGNLARGLLIAWLGLTFLAALGLWVASQFSLAVALLVTSFFFLVSFFSQYLARSLGEYAPLPKTQGSWLSWLGTVGHGMGSKIASGQYWDAFKILVRLLGEMVVALTPTLSRFDYVSLVADGRLVSWSMVASVALRVGLFWTALAGLLGWLMFRRRELDRASLA